MAAERDILKEADDLLTATRREGLVKARDLVEETKWKMFVSVGDLY